MQYLNKSGMHCKECGMRLESVDESQILGENRFIKRIVYCPKHAEEILGELPKSDEEKF